MAPGLHGFASGAIADGYGRPPRGAQVSGMVGYLVARRRSGAAPNWVI
jgi:hypothetical protein